MNSKTKLIVVSLLLIAMLSGAYILYDSLGEDLAPDNLTPVTTTTGATAQTQSTSKPLAPDFTVYDHDGNAVTLSSFRGKPVVLNFWASWCGPCKSEMPDFETAYKTYGEDIQFVMVNLTDGVQETVADASAFIKEQGYTFPVYYDSDLDAANTYGVYSVPVTYFIDADGAVAAQARGALSAGVLQKGINMIG